MIPYRKFRPTQFDTEGLGLDDRQDWLVIEAVGQTRDSDVRARVNFECALKMLGGESDDVEVHRFGHWGPGWFEIVLVRPKSSSENIAREIEAALADYPSLDDMALSEAEHVEACEIWEHASVKERVGYIKRCGADPKVSVFAARRDELPEGIYASDLVDS